MKKIIILLLFIPFIGHALTGAEIRTKAGELLIVRHPGDQKSKWIGLGSNAPPVLIQMYDEEIAKYKRLRLIYGISFFESQLADEFLKRIIEEDDDELAKSTALRTLGNSPARKRNIDLAAKFLKSDNPDFRVAAATSLKAWNTDESKKELKWFYENETTAWVKKKVKGGSFLLQPKVTKNWSDRFKGEWEGLWVIPNKKGKMISQPARLVLFKDQKAKFVGEIWIKLKENYELGFKLHSLKGKDNQMRGELINLHLAGKAIPTSGIAGTYNKFQVKIPKIKAEIDEKVLRLQASILNGTFVSQRK